MDSESILEIEYHSEHFPKHFSSQFRGVNVLSFSVAELFWSAITVGRKNSNDVVKHGIYSWFEMLYRSSIIAANISTAEGRLFKSLAYRELDPSEKGAVSYFLGLTFSKLFAARLLKTPFLLHLDVYKDQFEREGRKYQFGASRSRPDMIGLTKSRSWIVVESKGRTNGFEAGLMEKAKNQTRNLEKIGSETPELRVAAITYFELNELKVAWSDPTPRKKRLFSVNTDREEYLRIYYKLIMDLLLNISSSTTDGYVFHTFEDLHLTIGLDRNLFQRYVNRETLDIKPLKLTDFSAFSQRQEEYYCGDDGILVGVGQQWINKIANSDFNPKSK